MVPEQLTLHPTCRFPLWIVMTVSVCLWGTSAADASCGDYLHSTGPAMFAGDLTKIHRQIPVRGSVSTAPRPTCGSPDCQQAPKVPPSESPATIPSTSVDKMLSFSPPIPPESADRWKWEVGNVRFLPEDHRTGLDRPPRSRQFSIPG